MHDPRALQPSYPPFPFLALPLLCACLSQAPVETPFLYLLPECFGPYHARPTCTAFASLAASGRPERGRSAWQAPAPASSVLPAAGHAAHRASGGAILLALTLPVFGLQRSSQPGHPNARGPLGAAAAWSRHSPWASMRLREVLIALAALAVVAWPAACAGGAADGATAVPPLSRLQTLRVCPLIACLPSSCCPSGTVGTAARSRPWRAAPNAAASSAAAVAAAACPRPNCLVCSEPAGCSVW